MGLERWTGAKLAESCKPWQGRVLGPYAVRNGNHKLITCHDCFLCIDGDSGWCMENGMEEGKNGVEEFK